MDQIFFQWAWGKAAKAHMSAAAWRNMASTCGNWRPSLAAMDSSWLFTAEASGWAKTVRMAAATISAEPLGTLANTSLKEVDPTALPGRAQHHRGDGAFEALMGVGDDQAHAGQAPRAQAAQEGGPNAPDSESPTARPRTSRSPLLLTPVATTTASDTTWAPSWALT